MSDSRKSDGPSGSPGRPPEHPIDVPEFMDVDYCPPPSVRTSGLVGKALLIAGFLIVATLAVFAVFPRDPGLEESRQENPLLGNPLSGSPDS